MTKCGTHGIPPFFLLGRTAGQGWEDRIRPGPRRRQADLRSKPTAPRGDRDGSLDDTCVDAPLASPIRSASGKADPDDPGREGPAVRPPGPPSYDRSLRTTAG